MSEIDWCSDWITNTSYYSKDGSYDDYTGEFLDD